MSHEPIAHREPGRVTALLKRLGIAGVVFFFVKGLLWLTVPALLVYLGFRD
jgi:hypothetical protein